MAKPLVTVITPCYNSVLFIEETIQSVLNQSYAPVEYIVMDSASTDGTVELVRSYEPRLKLISEPDDGQANAINKGWQLAKGDILAWLNADDIYFPHTIQAAVDFLESNPNAGWTYGYSEMLNANGAPAPFRHPVFEWDYDRLLNEACYVIQPSVFIRRKVIEEFGLLREDLEYGMDYEYWLRIGRRYPGHLVPSIWTAVKWYRENKSLSGGVGRLNEIKQMVQIYGALDLPSAMRHEWAEAYLSQFFQSMRRAQIRQAVGSLKESFRYPSVVPRGFVKLLVRWIVPARLETKLRQWLIPELRIE